ncbi:MAG: hypothetical protein PHV49_02870, partial [Alistipes sp.]|nr:hypothetical protein [Alistipes sp.]
MKKYHYLWFAVCFGFVILFASCAKERSEGGDSNETPSGKLVASGERITLPVFSKGDISAYIQSALSSRFVAQTAELEKARVMLFSTESFVAANPQQLVEAYDRGVVFVIARPDMEQVERICNENDIPFGGAITNKNDLELFAFNSRGDSYSMDDPSDSNLSAQEEYNAYLNPFISWLNDILTKGASVQAAPDLRTEPQADVQKTFDYQTISHTFNVYLKKELGTVALSTPDTVEASGQVTLTMSIYPLYAFTDQSSPGDYYIVNTTLTAHNQTLYLGEFEHRHGGVHVHMCAYIMGHMNMTCTMDSKAGYTVDFPINGTPTPLTTQVSQTFTSGISWNLGGSLTGGLD